MKRIRKNNSVVRARETRSKRIRSVSKAKPKSSRKSAIEKTKARIRLTAACVFLPFIALAFRASYLSFFEERSTSRGKTQTLASSKLEAERGSVLDRHGSELVVSVKSPTIQVDVAEISDRRRFSEKLSSLLKEESNQILERLSKTKRVVLIKRWVEDDLAQAVRDANLPGVTVMHEPRRKYPFGELGAQVLGFTNIDGKGKRGIERLEDHWLRGKAQSVSFERDGKRRALVQGRVRRELALGGDISLTLDAGSQANVEKALATKIQETNALGGIAILMEPSNGSIVAMAEYPSFNPNEFRKVDYPLTRARAWTDAFEPGSTLKPFLVAGAFQEGAIEDSEAFDCEQGEKQIPGKLIKDSTAHGFLSVTDILRFSSNIGAAKIGFKLGAQKHFKTLERFGFGKKTGAGLPDESAGLLRHWRNWKESDHASISHGNGVNVTPLQLAVATGVLANRGVWREPRFIKARRRPGEDWRQEPMGAAKRIIQPEIAERVVDMLEAVVEGGTGQQANIPGAKVAGKTGTAQKYDAAEKRYSDNSQIAWFIGFATIEKDTLVSIIMIDDPQGELRSGGSVAAPLFATIVSDEFSRRGHNQEANFRTHSTQLGTPTLTSFQTLDTP